MLVLKRKPGETVVVDSVTTVRVESVESGTVRLSFDAPRDVKIVRGELFDEKLVPDGVAKRFAE